MRSVVGSGEFEGSRGMVNIQDKREDGLDPETHGSRPQDLVSKALVCALGLDAHFSPAPSILQQTPSYP